MRFRAVEPPPPFCSGCAVVCCALTASVTLCVRERVCMCTPGVMLILAFNDGRYLFLPSYYKALAVGADARKSDEVKDAIEQLGCTSARSWGIHRFLDYVRARSEVRWPMHVPSGTVAGRERRVWWTMSAWVG